ncbi:MAG: hypothetical protein QM781_00265 [Chitinophagaceae bacterium]
MVILIVLAQFIPAGYPVTVSLLKPAQREGLELKINVVNSSDDTVRVLKYRQMDYKREHIKALGNYVVEIQQLKGDKYILFSPTADIDPIFEEEEYILFKKGEYLCDTLYVAGALFLAKNSSVRGFPAGQYRVRVYFNPDRWYSTETNNSEWINFRME